MPVVRIPKPPPPKLVPPDRTWERPDYLPGLDEALAFNVPLMEDADLLTAPRHEELLWDCEVYENFFYVAFESYITGKIMAFEVSPWAPVPDLLKLEWILRTFCTVGFNTIKYDECVVTLLLAGCTTAQIKWASDKLIKEGWRAQDIYRQLKIKKRIQFNHIDLIEVAPLRANLKIYGGRLHARRMQDLPFAPHILLSYEQAAITKYYCINDLDNVRVLRDGLKPQVKMRQDMTAEYGCEIDGRWRLDLRSRSDAQIAEAVIGDEIWRLNGKRPRPPEIDIGTVYKYQVPGNMSFQTDRMKQVLQAIRDADFVVGDVGAVVDPEVLKENILIGEMEYKIGIGGLHSTESCANYVSNHIQTLYDIDATSFYPFVILNQGLYPQHLGMNFLRVYKGIVDRRIAALDRGNVDMAESLKIVINGTFGKFGSMFSILYAPDLLIQVTISGQLYLLMLIEAMELRGIRVVSANTDGVTMLVPKHLEAIYAHIIKEWELLTQFKTKQTEYLALFSRDVNDYMALKVKRKSDGTIETKTKGAFANPWSDPTKVEARLHKNPSAQICIEAMEKLLTVGTPIEYTIRRCTDVRQFISVRTVKDGGVKDGQYLGKSIRWYYSTQEREKAIVYARNGHKVPKSDGARPCLDLPETLPVDIDYEWYIEATEKLLKSVNYC